MSAPVPGAATALWQDFHPTYELLADGRLPASGEVDAVLVSVAETAVTDMAGIEAAVERAAEKAPHLPVLSVVAGARPDRPRRTTGFASSEAGVRALAHAVRYVRWLRTADSPMPVLGSGQDATSTRDPRAGTDTWLAAAASEELLSAIGIASAPWRLVDSARDPAEAAHDLGFPVVVKVGDPEIVHKTESKLVHTGLRTRREVIAAVRAVQEAAGPGCPVLVQKQVSGPEFAIGVVRDARFGPLVIGRQRRCPARPVGGPDLLDAPGRCRRRARGAAVPAHLADAKIRVRPAAEG